VIQPVLIGAFRERFEVLLDRMRFLLPYDIRFGSVGRGFPATRNILGNIDSH